MATNHELNQIRVDAEEADRANSERRAAKRGWPVNTADGEAIIAHSYYESAGSRAERKVLVTEDGEEYIFSPATREWVSRGMRAEADTEAEPEAEEPTGEKAADPLADEVADLHEGDKEVK